MTLFAAVPFLPLALPVAAAVAAIYLLLPRPNALPRHFAAVAGLAALAVFGLFLVRDAAHAPLVEAILFYGFSGMALIGGVQLITQSNPARGAVAFALVVLSTCGLFLLQGAPFLMAGTIIIYAGAIIVTFLFVIMLSQSHGPSDADGRSREPFLACLAGGFLLVVFLAVIQQQYDTRGFESVLAAAQPGTPVEELRDRVAALDRGTPAAGVVYREFEELEAKLADKTITPETTAAAYEAFRRDTRTTMAHAGDLKPSAAVPISAFSGTPTNKATESPQLPAANVAGLGRMLFSDFLLAVELGGTLLLVATIGAIAITHRATAERAA